MMVSRALKKKTRHMGGLKNVSKPDHFAPMNVGIS